MKTCPVWLCVLSDVPDRFLPLLREAGFRPSKKSGNWWRHYDDRLRGHTLARDGIREWAAAREIKLTMRPQRRTVSVRPTTRSNSTPSAAEWLRRNDPGLGKAKAIEKRQRAKAEAQARKNTVLVNERRKALRLS